MVYKVVQIYGQPMPLKALVGDLSRNMNLGIDTKRVFDGLGSKVVEKVEDLPNGVRRVTTLVVP